MNLIGAFYRSSIGKKWIVALTGLCLIGYVIGHLIGNLQIFIGRDQINNYAVKLHELGPLLWGVRIFLLGAFVLHIVTTIWLTIENREARDHNYHDKKSVASTSASRTMMISGFIVLSFVIYHLLHFTLQLTNPEYKTLKHAGHPDVYSMIITGFQNPFITFFYLLGVFLLCLHLSHGFQSIMQTLGLNSSKISSLISNGGRILAWAIFAGYASIPIAVLLNFLKLPDGL